MVINKNLSSIQVYYIRIKFVAENGMKAQVQGEKEQYKILNYYIRSYICIYNIYIHTYMPMYFNK